MVNKKKRMMILINRRVSTKSLSIYLISLLLLASLSILCVQPIRANDDAFLNVLKDKTTDTKTTDTSDSPVSTPAPTPDEGSSAVTSDPEPVADNGDSSPESDPTPTTDEGSTPVESDPTPPARTSSSPKSVTTTSTSSTTKTVTKIVLLNDTTTETDPHITTTTDTETSTDNNKSTQTYSPDLDKVKVEVLVETPIGNASSGHTITIHPTHSETTSINQIQFVPTTNLTNVTFTVAKLTAKPETITEEPTINGTIYIYLDIKLTANNTYLHEEEFDSLTFQFKLEKTWIEAHHIDSHSIKLMRYHDDVWQELPTTQLENDSTYIYYEAETPGLSTFAVVGTELVEIEDAYVTGSTVFPMPLNIILIALGTMLLGVILFKTKSVYLNKDKRHTLKESSSQPTTKQKNKH